MTTATRREAPQSVLYDLDFYSWTQDQAARLRALTPQSGLDLENLADEVADLGRSERNKTFHHLLQACTQLLKAAQSTAEEPQRHWRAETVSQQQQARTAFTPGMRQHLDIYDVWSDALKLANAGLRDFGEPNIYPAPACSFQLDDLLEETFDPEAALIRVKGALADARNGR
jgi:hypothetical protein